MRLENETHMTVEQAEYAITQEAAQLSEQEIAEANAWFDQQPIEDSWIDAAYEARTCLS